MESISLRKTIGIQRMIFMRILEPPFKNEQKSHSDVYNVKICNLSGISERHAIPSIER